MGTIHLFRLVLLASVFWELCEAGNTRHYDSQKILCYNCGRDSPSEVGERVKIFGILSKRSELEIYHVYPFNSAPLPEDKRIFSSRLFLQEYLQKNEQLLQLQSSFLGSDKLSTVNSDKIPFYHAGDMPKVSRMPRQSFTLNCRMGGVNCSPVFHC